MTTLPAHTWQLRITRHDGSVISHSEYKQREPQLHDFIELTIEGQKLRVKIVAIHKDPPREGAVGLGVWHIDANEE